MDTDWLKRLAAIEQASTELCDGLAPTVAAFWRRLVEEGVSESAATILAVQYMLGFLRGTSPEFNSE